MFTRIPSSLGIIPVVFIVAIHQCIVCAEESIRILLVEIGNAIKLMLLYRLILITKSGSYIIVRHTVFTRIQKKGEDRP